MIAQDGPICRSPAWSGRGSCSPLADSRSLHRYAIGASNASVPGNLSLAPFALYSLGVNILRLFQIAVLGLLIPSIASSADSCAARYDLDDDSCLCHEKAQSLSIPAPNGFSLVAACNMTDIKDGRTIPLKSANGLSAERFDMGTYLYKGRKTLTGKIVKAFDPMTDYSVIFYPTHRALPRIPSQNQSRLQRFSRLENFSLIEDERKIGTQSLVVTDNVSWCSEATITVHEIKMYVADTEGEGPYATKYDVVRLSKFRKC